MGEVFSLRSRVGQPHRAVSGEGEGYSSRLLNTHDKACMSKWLAWQSRFTSAAGGETPPTRDVAPVSGVSRHLY